MQIPNEDEVNKLKILTSETYKMREVVNHVLVKKGEYEPEKKNNNGKCSSSQ